MYNSTEEVDESALEAVLSGGYPQRVGAGERPSSEQGYDEDGKRRGRKGFLRCGITRANDKG